MVRHVAWAAALSLVLAAPAAAAQTAVGTTPQNTRRLHVAQRVRQGIAHRQLTRAEVSRIRTQASAVRSQIRALRSAGSATPEQRAAVRQALRRLNRTILVLRHNRIRRS